VGGAGTGATNFFVVNAPRINSFVSNTLQGANEPEDLLGGAGEIAGRAAGRGFSAISDTAQTLYAGINIKPGMVISNIVKHVSAEGERAIVVVWDGLEARGFYRSTGKSSGAPGEWFPFDGLTEEGWFDKFRYANPFPWFDRQGPRFQKRRGTLGEISEEL